MQTSIIPPRLLQELLAQRRRESGLSFQLLSERSQVDVAYLCRLEKGQASNPGRNIVLRIGIGLGLGLEAMDELLIAARHLPLSIGTPRPVTTAASQSAQSV
jgi:transcriptional regulator with XRE-family HTH domain